MTEINTGFNNKVVSIQTKEYHKHVYTQIILGKKCSLLVFDKSGYTFYNLLMDKDSLLSLIKNLRVSMSVSQAEMAKRVGMSASFYGMIERGNRTLSFEHFCKIAKALDCTPIDILMILERKN